MQQLVQIVATSSTIKAMHSVSDLKKIATIDAESKKGIHPGVIVQGKTNLGSIFSARHFVEYWTLLHDSKNNRYLLIRKMCKHDATTFKSGTFSIYQYIILCIKQIVPCLFQLDHVALVNFNGVMATSPATQKRMLFLYKLATAGIVNGFKHVFGSRIEQMNKGEWKPEDDLNLLQTMHSV